MRIPASSITRFALARALAAAAMLLAAQPMVHAQGAVAGRISFATGPAQILGADGASRPASTGQTVAAGERVVTGPDAYVHLRMIDKAFVALRPDSTLLVEVYDYDEARPQDSRIKLHLNGGNARTVSGKGGDAAKQNYRFGTPVAAIGLRGTDYTVLATDDATRVSVKRGAVVVSPFGEGCTAQSFGPCVSAAARELSAGTRHAYMEVSGRNPLPVLVTPEQDPKGGAGQNPPGRPAEPRAEGGGDGKPPPAPVQFAANSVVVDRLVSAASALPVPEVPAVAPPAAPVVQAPAQLVWGRWSTYAQGAGSPPVTALLTPDREVMVGNTMFGLLRSSTGETSLPTQGVVGFRLAGSEAYALSGNALSPAQVRDGTLSIDFRQRAFETGLAVQYAGGLEQMQARGAVQWQGFLIPDAARSTMRIDGALSRDGSEAAYLFEKPVAGGGLVGAVRWVR